MDNEASAALKDYFTEKYMSYQLVPSYCHRINSAERAIRTFQGKTFLLIIISGPILPYSFMGSPPAPSRNQSRLHPQLYDVAHYHSLIDYKKSSFAPPGCKIIKHKYP